MNSNLRTLISAIVITLSIVTAVLVGNSAPSAAHGRVQSLPSNCKAMQHIPSYSVKINKTDTAHVQSGKTLVKLAVRSSESRRDLKIQCRQLVLNYANDLIVIAERR